MARTPFAAPIVAVIVTACSSTVSSEYDRNADPTGRPPSGYSGDLGPSVPHADDVQNITPGSACASSHAGAAQKPIALVFMMDRSGSMGGSDIDAKWNAAAAALQTFYGEASASKIRASLAFFAQDAECTDAAYTTPAVAMRALPNATPFSDALGAVVPSGGTPTLPALRGAIAYAQSVKAAAAPDETVAIVLVTDGDPNDCASTPDNVAAEAAKVADTIKTYVVGVGSLAQNLDVIARGGGTGSHIQVDTSSADVTAAELRAAISRIKAAALGCTYALPMPPSGDALDVDMVNVDYTPAGGAVSTLPYSQDCLDLSGWHYDDPSAPTRIVICPDACYELQHDTSGGQVDVVFGCVTRGELPH